MAHYRKYIQPDPFHNLQRNLQSKLYKIQTQILQKFPQGEPRELMRRVHFCQKQTIQRLLKGETTIHGKIRQLMAVVQRCGGDGYAQTTHFTEGERESDLAVNYFEEKTGKKPKMIDFACSGIKPNQKGRNSFEEQSFRYQTQHSQSMMSLENSFSPSAGNASVGGNSKKSFASQKHTPSPSPLLYDSVNQNDIFSFRTQKEGQSTQNIKNINQKVKEGQVKMINKRASLSRSNSKDSIQYSQKGSNSTKKSQSFQKLSRNYDGLSQIYEPFIDPSQNNLKKSRKNLSPSKTKTLYQKILNRLKYSQCVITPTDHKKQTSSSNQLKNRVKLQQQTRTSLTKDVMAQVQNHFIWH